MQITVTREGLEFPKVEIVGADMVGTPKQVAYASDIRSKLIAEMVMETMHTRKLDVAAVNAGMGTLAKMLAGKTSAKAWIDLFNSDETFRIDSAHTANRVLLAMAKA